MSLTKVSYSMITGAPVNVLDYGASPSATGTVNSAAINSALATGKSVYIPTGTYLVATSLLPVTTQIIYGDGSNKTVIKAETVGMIVLSYPSGAYSNVCLRDFNINGDGKAVTGLSMISSSQGAVSNCEFNNIGIYGCTTSQAYFSQITYCKISRCVFIGSSSGAFGLNLQNCYSSECYDSIMNNGSTASLSVVNGSGMAFLRCTFYNEAANPSPSLVLIDSTISCTFTDCEFEPQGVSNVTSEVILKTTSTSCTDTAFTRCRFIGVANTKLQCVEIVLAYKTRFTECSFIKPSATNSILLTSQAETSFSRCFDLITYGSPVYAAATITNNSGNVYYMENLSGNFATALNALSMLGTSYVATGTASTRWTSGTGSPEGVVEAAVGCLYSRTDGSTSTTLYVKTSGTGSTGWTAK